MPKKDAFCYEGKRIRIRKLRPSDAESIYENARDVEIYRWAISIPRPYPRAEADRLIRKASYYLKRGKRYAFGIALKDSDRVIGIVDLFKVDFENKDAELGYWIGKKYRGKGLMSEAVELMLNFGFTKLKLHRIHANVFEGNTASEKVLKRHGFIYEGLSRESRFKCGKWQNELRYALLKKHWRIRKQANK